MSASVICPGFIQEVGMYADEVVARGDRAPWALGTSSVHAVAVAVVRAIQRVFEVIARAQERDRALVESRPPA